MTSASQPEACPECGTPMPAGSPLGLCPVCLVGGAIGEGKIDDACGDLGRIGAFALLEHLGEGGFGDVYLAEQSEPVRRQVALKVLKRGMDTRAIVARFGEEQQVLASLDHPGICRLFEAGETPDGRPFFAMEAVPGVPLTEFSKQSGRTPREVLTAFRDACRAVAHAHQHGIVHRDLKPSNILVTDDAVVKVIDFGLAKAVRSIPAEVTRTAEIFGTPQYLAPECADGSRAATPAADVFSLGKVLEEIGAPLDSSALARIATHEDPRRRVADAGVLVEKVDALLAGKKSGIGSGRLLIGIIAAVLLVLGGRGLFLLGSVESAVAENADLFGLTEPVEIQSSGLATWPDGNGNDWFKFAGAGGKTVLLAFDWNPDRPTSGHWVRGVRRPIDAGAELLEWGSKGDADAVGLYRKVLDHKFTPEEQSAATKLEVGETNQRNHPLWEAMALQKHLQIRLYFQYLAGYDKK